MAHLYTKPYKNRIDALCMPHSHQPPKFKQFGGKGNPNQYIAVMLELKETDW